MLWICSKGAEHDLYRTAIDLAFDDDVGKQFSLITLTNEFVVTCDGSTQKHHDLEVIE